MSERPREWWNLTLSEWANLAAASGTMLSAVFAFMAVLAANAQVKTAIDVVNRGEKLKSLSVYADAAHAACKSIIPADLAEFVTRRPLDDDGSEIPPDKTYIIRPLAENVEQNARNYRKKGYQFSVSNKFDEMIEKSNSLEIWLDNKAERTDLNRFSRYLYRTSSREADRNPNDNLIYLQEAYGVCQDMVDKKVAELTR